MKKFALLPLILTGLSGCATTSEISQNNIYAKDIPVVSHEYFEVENYFITQDDIFFSLNSKYYVYFYSLNCSHCGELKDWIIDVALKKGDIYFLKGSNKDKISNDVSSTIGANSVDKIYILGYPTILEIQNGIVTKNIAGYNKIRSFFEH